MAMFSGDLVSFRFIIRDGADPIHVEPIPLSTQFDHLQAKKRRMARQGNNKSNITNKCFTFSVCI